MNLTKKLFLTFWDLCIHNFIKRFWIVSIFLVMKVKKLIFKFNANYHEKEAKYSLCWLWRLFQYWHLLDDFTHWRAFILNSFLANIVIHNHSAVLIFVKDATKLFHLFKISFGNNEVPIMFSTPLWFGKWITDNTLLLNYKRFDPQLIPIKVCTNFWICMNIRELDGFILNISFSMISRSSKITCHG